MLVRQTLDTVANRGSVEEKEPETAITLGLFAPRKEASWKGGSKEDYNYLRLFFFLPLSASLKKSTAPL